MSLATLVLAALVTSVVVVAVVKVLRLTIKKLKSIIGERLERRRKSKVIFGETRKIVDKKAKDIIESAPSVSMEELESACEEVPYFVVDYDPTTEEMSDCVTIMADDVDEKVEDMMYANEGIVLFE